MATSPLVSALRSAFERLVGELDGVTALGCLVDDGACTPTAQTGHGELVAMMEAGAVHIVDDEQARRGHRLDPRSHIARGPRLLFTAHGATGPDDVMAVMGQLGRSGVLELVAPAAALTVLVTTDPDPQPLDPLSTRLPPDSPSAEPRPRAGDEL